MLGFLHVSKGQECWWDKMPKSSGTRFQLTCSKMATYLTTAASPVVLWLWPISERLVNPAIAKEAYFSWCLDASQGSVAENSSCKYDPPPLNHTTPFWKKRKRMEGAIAAGQSWEREQVVCISYRDRRDIAPLNSLFAIMYKPGSNFGTSGSSPKWSTVVRGAMNLRSQFLVEQRIGQN